MIGMVLGMRKVILKVLFVVIWILGLIFRWSMIGDDYGLESRKKGVGCIAEEAEVRSNGVRYVFEFEDVYGKVLVYGPKYPVYKYGDCLEVSGILNNPENKRDFDYVNYLKRYAIYKIMYVDSLKLIDSNGGNNFFKGIYWVKDKVDFKLGLIFTEPYKSFMAGLLMGSKRGLPDYLTENFKKVGLSHIMAISGYNITLIIVLISGFFWFLKKNLRTIISGVCVIVFVIFVGMSASAVRACVMGILGLLAMRYERKYDVERGLFITIFVVGLWNPLILIYDAGFQLSVLATGGLIYILPWLKKRFKIVPEILGIKEIGLGSLAAQIAVLPVMIFGFGRVSLLGVFANILVLPLIPIIMFFGFFAVIIGSAWNGGGMIFGFLAFLVMKLVILIVELFAKIPFVDVKLLL